MKLVKLIKNIKWEVVVLLLFTLSRLPGLGHDNFNTDVWKWKARSYDFSTGVFTLDFEKTLQMYHPGVTLMWLGAFGVKVYNGYFDLVYKTTPPENNIHTVFGLDFVQKLLVVVTIGICLAFVLYVLRKLFGLKYAFLSIFLLSFEPLYLALSRVFHLEGLMSSFMLVSALWLFYYFQEQKRGRLMLSGVFAGLAVLTKTTAIYLVPFTALMMLIYGFREQRKFILVIKYILQKFGLWLLCLVVIFFALWPALWVDLQGAFNEMYKGITVVGIDGEHEQFYFNKFVMDPGPTFYPVVLGYKSSIWLLAGLLGTILFWRKVLDGKKKELLIFLLIFILFFLIQITIPSKKLDRYVIPIITALSLISSFFYLWFLEKVKINKALKYLVIILPVLFTVLYLHPDYFSYYNPLLGGLSKGIYVIEPKWLIGASEIQSYFKNMQKTQRYNLAPNDKSLEYLISSDKATNILIVAFPEKYYTQVWPYFREIQAWAVIDDIIPQSSNAQYFVYPVWDDASAKKTEFKFMLVGTIKVRGTEAYRVYERI